MQRCKKKQGFTLVELSIVLVIIGLLIGGILGGQELIRSSELNSITSDVNKYQVSLNAFKLKYNGLPGDITNASSYWPTCATPATLCNGNGDGLIGSPYTTPAGFPESYRAWQLLNLSGIVPGNYSGVTGGGGTHESLVGTNVPAFKISWVGASLASWGQQPDSAWIYAGNYTNAYFLGGYTTGDYTQTNFLPPADARSIDVKVDDGLPGLGKWVTQRNQITCHNDVATGSAATYTLTNTDIACAFVFRPYN